MAGQPLDARHDIIGVSQVFGFRVYWLVLLYNPLKGIYIYTGPEFPHFLLRTSRFKVFRPLPYPESNSSPDTKETRRRALRPDGQRAAS